MLARAPKDSIGSLGNAWLQSCGKTAVVLRRDKARLKQMVEDFPVWLYLLGFKNNLLDFHFSHLASATCACAHARVSVCESSISFNGQ